MGVGPFSGVIDVQILEDGISYHKHIYSLFPQMVDPVAIANQDLSHPISSIHPSNRTVLGFPE